MQTNQRAELSAALAALEAVGVDEGVEIVSDSVYTINSMTVWLAQWRKNRWAKKLVNEDLHRAIDKVLAARDAAGATTVCTHVPAHAGIVGNEQADALAKAGAAMDP